MFALVFIAATESWVGLSREALSPAAEATDQAEPDYGKRVAKIARHFIGAPYVFAPLGEGNKNPPGNQPTFRTDAFDCLSLVETSLALAAEPDFPQVLETLAKIRYTDSRVDFAYRKHFPESQWIPENERAGLIKDITREVGGDLAVPVEKTVTPVSYAKRKKALELDLPRDRIPNGTFRWWMIPIDKMEEVMAKIPTGALVFVVREDYFSIPFRISHVGIVAQHKEHNDAHSRQGRHHSPSHRDALRRRHSSP